MCGQADQQDDCDGRDDAEGPHRKTSDLNELGMDAPEGSLGAYSVQPQCRRKKAVRYVNFRAGLAT